ncbi:hypothetical protein [Lysobacter gummosus]|uniref:hypothetical protein n=1 Tax=Lysobacter gummosus TaxID=262324 RepID=UPI003632DC9A
MINSALSVGVVTVRGEFGATWPGRSPAARSFRHRSKASGRLHQSEAIEVFLRHAGISAARVQKGRHQIVRLGSIDSGIGSARHAVHRRHDKLGQRRRMSGAAWVAFQFNGLALHVASACRASHQPGPGFARSV